MKATNLSFLALGACLLGGSRLLAQATWTGTGALATPALWSDSTNWSGTPPSSSGTSSLTFNNTANSWSNNDLSSVTVSGITCISTTRDNIISGIPITLAGPVLSSTGAWQWWNNDIILQGSQIFDITNGRFHLNGKVSDGTPAGGITKSGNGWLLLNGDNSFTGNVAINGGSIELGHANALGSGGTISFGGGTLRYGTGVTTDYSGRFGTADNQVFRIDTNGNDVVLAQGISSNGGSIIKSSAGNLTLGAANNLGAADRLTISNACTVHLDDPAALGSPGGFVRFANNQNITLSIRTNDPLNTVGLGGGSTTAVTTISLGRMSEGDGYVQLFSVLDLGSRALTFVQGANVLPASPMSVDIGEVRLTAGNNDRPVSLISDMAMTVGSASVTLNGGFVKRLGLDGTNPNNQVVGVISDGITGARIEVLKTNSGTWRLSGFNSYTGNTTVEAGRLILDQPSIRDIGLVSIASGAVLELNHAETDVVNVLRLNGVNQVAGTYDASNTGGAIAGTGRIEVRPTAFHIANADGTLWSNAATWQGAPPVAGGTSAFTFISMVNRTSVNDLANVTASSIQIPAGGRDNTLNGSNTLTLAGDVVVGTGNWQTINMPLAISGDRTFDIQTGRLTLGGVVSGTSTDGIIKTGGGALHITGTSNTFAGDLTVSGGVVLVSNAFLADTSTVTINAGTLDLPHGQPDTVNKLVIGGVEKSPGIYKSQSNTTGEGTSIPQITGTGSLVVLSGPAPSSFSLWAEQNITNIDPAADASPAGDPDGDGQNNLAEFAFRGNPLSGTDQGLVRSFTADGSDADDSKELILTIAIRKANPAAFGGSPLQLVSDGVTYTVEGSNNLSSFTAGVSEVSPAITTGLPDLSADPAYEYRSFSLDASNGLAGKGFLRAKVEN